MWWCEKAGGWAGRQEQGVMWTKDVGGAGGLGGSSLPNCKLCELSSLSLSMGVEMQINTIRTRYKVQYIVVHRARAGRVWYGTSTMYRTMYYLVGCSSTRTMYVHVQHTSGLYVHILCTCTVYLYL